MLPEPRADSFIAVCLRAQTAAIAVFHRGQLYEVIRRRKDHAPAGVHQLDFIAQAVTTTADEYGVTTIVIEPNNPVVGHLSDARLRQHYVTFEDAKRRLLPSTTAPTHADLYDHLVGAHPKLRRFVRILPATGAVSLTDPKRTVILLAVALGLAVLHDGDHHPHGSCLSP